jgi:hypothetical protein
MHLEIKRDILEYINGLPENDRKLIKSHLVELEDLLSAGNVEYIRDDVFRMRISLKHTGFIVVFRDCIRIVDIITNEQANEQKSL